MMTGEDQPLRTSIDLVVNGSLPSAGTMTMGEIGSQGARRGANVGFVVLCAALSVARQRGPGALDTLWAEDGSVFLQTALMDASPRVWLEGYAGYLQLVPRVLASISASLPLDWAPLVLSGGAAMAVAAAALMAYRAAKGFIPARGERAALAIAVLALPSAGLEVANAAANIAWYLLYVSVCLALWRPEGRPETALACVVLFLTAATHPFAVLVAPLLASSLLRYRRLADVVLSLALTAGMVLQVWVVLPSAGSRPLDAFATSPATLAQWYGFHVLETAVFGITLRNALVDAIGVTASGALTVAILAFLLAPALSAARRRPFVPATLAGLHFGFYVLPVALAGTAPPRYAIAPILLLYSLIAWGFAAHMNGLSRLQRRVAAGLLAVVAVLDFSPVNSRAEGPGWSDELSRARTDCTRPTLAAATIPISPRNLPDGDRKGLDGYWTVVIPCERLAAY
jgi:hypothetical protein